MHVLSCNQAFKNPIKFANYFDRGRIFSSSLTLEYAFERCLLKFKKSLKIKILKNMYFFLLRGGLFGSKISS